MRRMLAATLVALFVLPAAMSMAARPRANCCCTAKVCPLRSCAKSCSMTADHAAPARSATIARQPLAIMQALTSLDESAASDAIDIAFVAPHARTAAPPDPPPPRA